MESMESSAAAAADGLPALPPAQWEALRAAYRSPPRAYHDWTHVEEVLGHYADISAGPGWGRPVETWLAVLYHDAIYEPGRRDNEARAAKLAEEEQRKQEAEKNTPDSYDRDGNGAERYDRKEKENEDSFSNEDEVSH